MSTWTQFFGGGDGAELIDEQIYATSGTWSKPAFVEPLDWIRAELWAGGAAGSREFTDWGSYDVDVPGLGGHGGSYITFLVRAYMVADTELVSVGSGGVPMTAGLPSTGQNEERNVSVAGNGGDTVFAGVKALGARGATVVTHNNGVLRGVGGDMGPHIIEDFGTMLRANSFNIQLVLPRPDLFIDRGVPLIGFAGAQGGTILTNAQIVWPGNTSPQGGDGGAGRRDANGDPGTTPGGGGGATVSGSGRIGGAGARGEARIRIYRGV